MNVSSSRLFRLSVAFENLLELNSAMPVDPSRN